MCKYMWNTLVVPVNFEGMAHIGFDCEFFVAELIFGVEDSGQKQSQEDENFAHAFVVFYWQKIL